MALIGVVQGTRWLSAKQRERDADSNLERVASSLGLEDDLLRESQLVLSGFLRDAKLTALSNGSKSVQELRHEAARVEGQFLGDASQRIDGLVDEAAQKRSGWLIRLWYETLLMSFVSFVLYRVVKSFFWDSLDDPSKILPSDFYVNAGVLFLIWATLLVMLFTRRLRRGLHRQVENLAADLAQQRLAQGLFPAWEEACREVRLQVQTLELLGETATQVRERLAAPATLGAAR